MEWSERMNAALQYIEENLEYEIDINNAAGKAYCSSHHFQHMFFAIIGVTVTEYIRRRRLTLAASDIMMNNTSVIDVALKYGYDSPNAFTRAFRNLHGINPGSARGSGIKLTAYPRISFYIELKGGTDMMDYQIVEKPAFEVIGRSKKFSATNGEHFKTIPEYSEEYFKSREAQELWKLIDMKNTVTGAPFLTVSYSIENDIWDPILYVICIEKSAKPDNYGFEVFQIPAATWAIFNCTLETIRDVRIRVSKEWFPSTGYEHDLKPEIEAYFSKGVGQWPHRIELWYPVVKNNK